VQIIPSTKRDYAHIVWTKKEKERIEQLQELMSPEGSDIPSSDFWDEIISEKEPVPNKPRSEEGKILR